MTDNEPKGWEIQFDDKFVKDCSKHDAPIIPCHHWRQEDNVGGVKDFIRDNFIPKAEVRKVVFTLGNEVPELYGGKLPFVIFPGKVSDETALIIYRQALSDLLRALHISDE